MKKKNFTIIIILIIVIFSFLSYFFVKNMLLVLKKDNFLQFDEEYYKNLNPIDIQEIMKQNIKENRFDKLIVEEIELEYNTLYKENSDLPKGFFRTVQLGNVGKQNVIFKQSFEDSVLMKEEIVANNVIKNSVEKIIEIGTGKGYVKTKVKKGDKLFVCANNLFLKKEKSLDSNDICQLKLNENVEIIDIEDNWYFVSYNDYNGYVVKEGISTYNPNKKSNSNSGDIAVFSKEELLSRLDFNMDVSIPSDLSLEQFEAVFENSKYDKNNVFKNNAKYFYYAEEQYGINGIFLAAIGVHESAWGTSIISKNKKNLFGYAAYDRDPYNSASNFATYSEGIDLVARVLIKNYLNESGTVVFDGSVANGRFYSGKTISSVNNRYATDKNWANCVFKWMKELYNSIPE